MTLECLTVIFTGVSPKRGFWDKAVRMVSLTGKDPGSINSGVRQAQADNLQSSVNGQVSSHWASDSVSPGNPQKPQEDTPESHTQGARKLKTSLGSNYIQVPLDSSARGIGIRSGSHQVTVHRSRHWDSMKGWGQSHTYIYWCLWNWDILIYKDAKSFRLSGSH